jgi:nitrogen fixation NifU-like protein
MSELASLYQEILLDHYKRPRSFGVLEDADSQSEGHNPLCGDRFVVYLALDGDRVRDISFEGAGCAISTASASLMCEAVKGKTVAEAESLFGAFHGMLTGDPSQPAEVESGLGKLAALSGVRAYPIRVKCATLAWHTLQAALEKREETVSTE